MPVSLSPREPITSLDQLLQLLANPEKEVVSMSLHCYVTLGGTLVQLEECFEEKRGALASKVPCRVSSVSLSVFHEALQRRFVQGLAKAGFTSIHEYSITYKGIEYLKGKSG